MKEVEVTQEIVDKVKNLTRKTQQLNKAMEDFIQARDEFKTE